MSSLVSNNNQMDKKRKRDGMVDMPNNNKKSEIIEVLTNEEFLKKYTTNIEYEDDDEDDENIEFNFKSMWDTACQNMVNMEFVIDNIDIYSHVVIAYDIINGKKRSIRGYCFCITGTDKREDKFLKIDVICRAQSTRMNTRSETCIPRGKDIIQSVHQLAMDLGCNYVKLNALPHVIGYYYKCFGYRFMKHCNEDPDKYVTKNDINDYMKILKEKKNDITHNDIPKSIQRLVPKNYSELNKIPTDVTREELMYDGFKTTRDYQKSLLGDDGYPMILCLKPMKGGKKRKNKKNKTNKKKVKGTKKHRKRPHKNTKKHGKRPHKNTKKHR